MSSSFSCTQTDRPANRKRRRERGEGQNDRIRKCRGVERSFVSVNQSTAKCVQQHHDLNRTERKGSRSSSDYQPGAQMTSCDFHPSSSQNTPEASFSITMLLLSYYRVKALTESSLVWFTQSSQSQINTASESRNLPQTPDRVFRRSRTTSSRTRGREQCQQQVTIAVI